SAAHSNRAEPGRDVRFSPHSDQIADIAHFVLVPETEVNWHSYRDGSNVRLGQSRRSISVRPGSAQTTRGSGDYSEFRLQPIGNSAGDLCRCLIGDRE